MKMDFVATVKSGLEPMRFHVEKIGDRHIFTKLVVLENVDDYWIHISVDSDGLVKIWHSITRQFSTEERPTMLEHINSMNQGLTFAHLCISQVGKVDLSCHFQLVKDAELAETQCRNMFLEFWNLLEKCGSDLTAVIDEENQDNESDVISHLSTVDNEDILAGDEIWRISDGISLKDIFL